jgi:mannose-6-phosphate isomerase-like protein (cupin superfamily)
MTMLPGPRVGNTGDQQSQNDQQRIEVILMSARRQTTVKQHGESRKIGVVGDVFRFLVMGEDTDGRYAQWEAIVPPGDGPPPHIHSREEEGFYILEGEITIQVGDSRFVAVARTFANMPVGSLHSFKNESSRSDRRPGIVKGAVVAGRGMNRN